MARLAKSGSNQFFNREFKTGTTVIESIITEQQELPALMQVDLSGRANFF